MAPIKSPSARHLRSKCMWQDLLFSSLQNQKIEKQYVEHGFIFLFLPPSIPHLPNHLTRSSGILEYWWMDYFPCCESLLQKFSQNLRDQAKQKLCILSVSNMTYLTLWECNCVWVLCAIDWSLNTVKFDINWQSTDGFYPEGVKIICVQQRRELSRLRFYWSVD